MMKPFARTSAAALALALLSGLASAQEAYRPPRLADGHPDLQGVWTNASLTALERPANFKELVIPHETAARMEAQRAQMMATTNKPTDPKEGAPTDHNADNGYNTFWMDPGSKFGVVKGETRSSWIVSPADGRIPYTKEGRDVYERRLTRLRSSFDGPEIRPQGERCIVGFGSTGGPPMVNVLYNNNYQIVQTANYVVVESEMIHDARIIPIGGQHDIHGFPKWLGDSVAHWDGDTLVVETVNFHPDILVRPNMTQSFYVGENPIVTERFTRVAADAILYEFTVADPKAFTQPWKAEMTLRTSPARMYEYACHEGNYALPGILRGARNDERKGVKTVVGSDAE